MKPKRENSGQYPAPTKPTMKASQSGGSGMTMTESERKALVDAFQDSLSVPFSERSEHFRVAAQRAPTVNVRQILHEFHEAQELAEPT